jgi:hypothetical protein
MYIHNLSSIGAEGVARYTLHVTRGVKLDAARRLSTCMQVAVDQAAQASASENLTRKVTTVFQVRGAGGCGAAQVHGRAGKIGSQSIEWTGMQRGRCPCEGTPGYAEAVQDTTVLDCGGAPWRAGVHCRPSVHEWFARFILVHFC